MSFPAPSINPPAMLDFTSIALKGVSIGSDVSLTGLATNKDKTTQYGAKGDGVSDDTAAIAAAVNAAINAGGGKVFFPAGTYLISAQIALGSYVVLQGCGMDITTIRASGSMLTSMFRFIGPSSANHGKHVQCFDMTIDGAGMVNANGAFTAQLFLRDVDFIRVERVRFYRAPTFGVFFAASSNSAPYIIRPVVRGCIFDSTGNGVAQIAGTLNGAIAAGSSVSITLNQNLPANTAAGSVFVLEPGVAGKEEQITVGSVTNANTFVASSVQYAHISGVNLTGVRADSIGGGICEGSIYVDNYFTNVAGNAIDNTLTDGGVWAFNRVDSPATSAGSFVPGSITADFGLQNSIIAYNVLNGASIGVGDGSAAGQPGNQFNIVEGNVINGGYINFYTQNFNVNPHHTNRGNIVRGNSLISGTQSTTALSFYDQNDLLVESNVVYNPYMTTQTAFLTLSAGNQAGSGCNNVSIRGNHFIDDRGGATTRYNYFENLTTAQGSNIHVDNNHFFSSTGAAVGLAGIATTRLSGNVGYNPVGKLASQPAVPASGTAFTNNKNVDCTVFITGGTVTVINVGGNATGLIAGTFRVAAGQTITLTYTVAPTWLWFGD